MPIPRFFLTRFYRLTFNRDFAEAERVLGAIKEKVSKSDWYKGYILALEGMLTAYRARNDRHMLINKIQLGKENLQHLQKEFQERARNLIGAEFDRGFFTAWADLIQFLNSTKHSNLLKPKNRLEEKEAEVKEET